LKKFYIILLFLFIFIICSQNIRAGNNIFYSQMKEAMNLAQKQNNDFFPGSFSGRINQNKELIRCQIFFYRPVEEIPGSYEAFDYNYKNGKITTRLREKKDNNIFHPRNLDFIKNLIMNQLPDLEDPNTFFSFKLFGETPYLYFNEKLESGGEKVTRKTYLDDKYQIIPCNSKDDCQEYREFVNRTILSLELPNSQEVFIIAKKALKPWLNRVPDGLEVRYVKNNNGIVTTKQIIEAMDEQTLAVSICSVEPSSGFRYDLHELGRVCKERNVYLVVDATQSLGAMELDVQEMNIDVMVASTYKWLNNVFGIGVGFIRKELLVKIVPNHMGWVGTRDRIKDFSNPELTINEGAKRFETGGLNWIGLSGLAGSINTYLSLGKRDVENHILALVDVLYRGIEGLENVKLLPLIPLCNRSNIVYLKAAESIHMTEDDFRANGIRVNISGSKIRVGIHFYNNESDLHSLIDYLKLLNAKN